MDFFYPGSVADGLVSVAARDRPPPQGTGSYAATALPAKGRIAYGISYLVGWLRGLGYKRLVVKSDNERALLSLLSAVSESMPGVEMVPQTSPEGDAAANGFAESAVRELKTQAAVLKAELETKLGRAVARDEAVSAWFARHAANVINRFRLGTDGASAEQRRTGRKWRRATVSFGETAFFKPVRAGREGRARGEERMRKGDRSSRTLGRLALPNAVRATARHFDTQSAGRRALQRRLLQKLPRVALGPAGPQARRR